MPNNNEHSAAAGLAPAYQKQSSASDCVVIQLNATCKPDLAQLQALSIPILTSFLQSCGVLYISALHRSAHSL